MKRIFVNGKIFTSCEECKYADAIITENGIITWVGSWGETRKNLTLQEGAEIVDLKGCTVIPGFVDAHMHPMMLAEYSSQIACLPPKIHSIHQLTEEIARRAEETPADGWIRGWGYDEGKYEEKRSPDRYDIDRGCSDKPVFLVRSCEHIRCLNSKALEIAGITKDTPYPLGGSIGRDERGEPNGILRENARDLVIPFMPEETEDEMVDALVELGSLLVSQGIVAIADMGNLHPGGNRKYYEKAAKKGFRPRVAMYCMWDYFMDNPSFRISREDMNPESRIRIAGLKLIADGSISGKTAWLNEPYLGTEDFGMSVCSDASLEAAIAFAKAAGCQISVHAMGGRAVDRIVDRVSTEDDWTDGRAPYLRIEHVTEPSGRAMETAAAKGFAFVSQPIFEYCEIETYRTNMDADRLQHIYPHRTELARGVKLAFSTDAPATSWAVPSDPFSNIKSAVTRRAYDGTDIGQSERIDVETAVMLYTKNAAEVCGFAGLGMLAPGYSADFVVLSDDIFTISPDRIDRVTALETYIDGEALLQARRNSACKAFATVVL